MNAIVGIVNQSLMITGFVFVMMLVIEYLNVLTSGTWRRRLTRFRWPQYVLAAFLGATPGCLGAFIVVAMFSHRMLSLGAVVAAMIATTGDETFVMLAVVPTATLILTGALFVIGVGVGFLTDELAPRFGVLKAETCGDLEIHTFEDCQCFPRGRIIAQWRSHSPIRSILSFVLALFLFSMAVGQIGPSEWNWVKFSSVFVGSIGLFIVATVPDHFLEEHLWNHVAKKHVLRIFLWTLGALLAIHILTEQLNLEKAIEDNLWAVLGVASLVGVIPESGPHLLFVMLFAKGTIPFSILLANSVVQDGHGMLPLLAHSQKAFIVIKVINLAVGLLVGGGLLLFGL